MGVKGKPDITDIVEQKRLQWYGHVKRMPEERIPKLVMNSIPRETRERGRPRKNVIGRSTSSHDNKKFRTRSVEKQRGMTFGFRKTATAVKKPDRYRIFSNLIRTSFYRFLKRKKVTSQF